MFPIIPHYYSDKPTVANGADLALIVVENEASETRRPKIIVESSIQANSVSRNIKIEELFLDDPNQDIRLKCLKEGTIDCKPNSWNWIKKVKLAQDCHSFNVKLCRSDCKRDLVLRVNKKIRPFENLLMWFSHDLLTILQIPFLAPENIQGEKQYVCHICNFQCEMPNPLKIHLALNCDTDQQHVLWDRLKTYNSHSDLSIPLNSNFTFQLSSHSGSETQKELVYSYRICKNELKCSYAVSHNTIISPIPGDSSCNSKEGISAFKPYVKTDRQTKFNRFSITHETNKSDIVMTSMPSRNSLLNQEIMQSTDSLRLHEIDYSKCSENALNILNKEAAQMETIVSNMGRLKDGHLCIYCGKMYSRKYGLKIHIRTHTGFKPLKCKYCLRPFGDPSNLNKHVRLHSEGDAPYKCNICGKVLVRKRDLDRHMKSRHQFEELH